MNSARNWTLSQTSMRTEDWLMDSSATVITRPEADSAGRTHKLTRSQTRQALVPMCFCALACLFVGTSFGAAHLLSQYPYTTGQALRYGLAAVVLALVIRTQSHIERRRPQSRPTTRSVLTLRHRLRIAALAATGGVGFNLAILAAERTAEPAVPGVVVGCSPLVVAVLVPLLGRRRPSARLACGALLVVTGAAVVQGFGHTTVAGLAFSLIALGGEVCFSLIAVPLLRVVSPLVLSANVCAAAAIEATVLAFAFGGLSAWRMPTTGQTAALLWQALPVTVGAFCLFYAGLRRLGPERAQLFVGLMPIAAAGCAPVLGAGVLGWAQLTGSGLVGSGVILGSTGPAARPASEPDHQPS